MAQLNKKADTPAHQTESHFDFVAWLSQNIDTKSEETQAAIKELSLAHRYASLRACMATDFAERLQELKSEELDANSSAIFERCRQEYSRDIEAILDELSETLRDTITHGRIAD